MTKCSDSGVKRYRVKSRKGKEKLRCLPDDCRRSADSRFWFKRNSDGKCGRIEANLSGIDLSNYDDFRRERRLASSRRSRRNKKSKKLVPY